MILARAATGMVGMGVGDQRPVDLPPGVNVEAARRTIKALGRQLDQVGHLPFQIAFGMCGSSYGWAC
jgi:hypothetical protein